MSPYRRDREQPIDYAALEQTCPNCIRACRQEAVWLSQSLFLGHDDAFINQVCDAIDKLRSHAGDLH